ncbi:MAG: hypothetical protein ABI649_08735, partial [Gaiellaceae bacterium]
VWVGYPDRLRPMLTEYDGDPVAGGTFPALIWKSFASRALRHENEPPLTFPAPQSEYAVPREVVFRDNHWLLDNGNCRDTRQVMYVVGSGPTQQAACKPNEVDVPRVIGAKLADAEARLEGMPLTVEVITRPAKGGELLNHVVAQYPSTGTLSSYDTVRIVVPKAEHGRIPDVVGMLLENARHRLARRRLAALVVYVDGKPGVVLQQFPRAGLAAAPNLTIRLIVGR